MLERVADKLAELFGVDLRSLGVVRIGVGVLLLVDLALRATDFEAHYLESGVVPRARLGVYGARATGSLHAIVGGSPVAEAALFLLAAGFAVALLAGWRTRLATVVSWVLLFDLQWRNPGLNTGGDVMLRMLLFWGMWLPWGARFGLDARRQARAAPDAAPSDAFVSVASVGLLLQVCFVYWFAVAHRTGPLWWEGKALFYALHYDQFTTPLGVWLRDHEGLLPLLSKSALWLEILGPLLAFVPIATGPCRFAAVLLFGALHLGLALLIALGLFPAVFLVAWLAFLPPWFWDRLLPRLVPGRSVSVRRGPPVVAPLWAEAAVAVALVLVILTNAKTLAPERFDAALPPGWDAPARWLRIDQRWGLYAPDPPRFDGWYVITGAFADGREVDLLDPAREPSFAKPRSVSGALPLRWRRLFFEQELQSDSPLWADTVQWLCRRWNRSHAEPERLSRARFYFVRETTHPDGPRREGIETLYVGDCRAEQANQANPDSAEPPPGLARPLEPTGGLGGARPGRRSVLRRPVRWASAAGFSH